MNYLTNNKLTNIEQTVEIFKHFEKYIKLSNTLKNELANRVIFKIFKKGELITLYYGEKLSVKEANNM